MAFHCANSRCRNTASLQEARVVNSPLAFLLCPTCLAAAQADMSQRGLPPLDTTALPPERRSEADVAVDFVMEHCESYGANVEWLLQLVGTGRFPRWEPFPWEPSWARLAGMLNNADLPTPTRQLWNANLLAQTCYARGVTLADYINAGRVAQRWHNHEQITLGNFPPEPEIVERPRALTDPPYINRLVPTAYQWSPRHWTLTHLCQLANGERHITLESEPTKLLPGRYSPLAQGRPDGDELIRLASPPGVLPGMVPPIVSLPPAELPPGCRGYAELPRASQLRTDCANLERLDQIGELVEIHLKSLNATVDEFSTHVEPCALTGHIGDSETYGRVEHSARLGQQLRKAAEELAALEAKLVEGGIDISQLPPELQPCPTPPEPFNLLPESTQRREAPLPTDTPTAPAQYRPEPYELETLRQAMAGLPPLLEPDPAEVALAQADYAAKLAAFDRRLYILNSKLLNYNQRHGTNYDPITRDEQGYVTIGLEIIELLPALGLTEADLP